MVSPCKSLKLKRRVTDMLCTPSESPVPPCAVIWERPFCMACPETQLHGRKHESNKLIADTRNCLQLALSMDMLKIACSHLLPSINGRHHTASLEELLHPKSAKLFIKTEDLLSAACRAPFSISLGLGMEMKMCSQVFSPVLSRPLRVGAHGITLRSGICGQCSKTTPDHKT